MLILVVGVVVVVVAFVFVLAAGAVSIDRGNVAIYSVFVIVPVSVLASLSYPNV